MYSMVVEFSGDEPDLSFDWLQVEQAAAGCVSGTLEEWPDLNRALCRVGVALPLETPAGSLRVICRLLLSAGEESDLLEV